MVLFLVTTSELALAGNNRERLNLHVTSFVQDWGAVLRLLNSLRVGLIGC